MKEQANVLCLLDQNYRTWRFYSDGRIQKPDGYVSDGKSWEFVGIRKNLPFGRVGPLIPRDTVFNALTSDILPWRHKNGKMRYRIQDNDHGTTRFLGGF